MRQYEMTYLISDKVNDSDLTAATGKINGIVTSHKGKILGEDNWGRRKLAYPIGKQEFATYVTLNFELDPSQLALVARELKLANEVLRHLIVVKDFGKEELKLTADEIAETEEIEEAVGGERSFEAVEGETEESYDLMAKRTEEETEETKEDTEEKVEEKVEATKAEEETAEEVEDEAEEIAEAEEEAEEAKEETAKPAKEEKKPAAKKATVKKTKKDEDTDKKKVKDEEEKAKKKKEEEKAEQEADRLAKLDEEIEGILGDDL